MKFQKSIKKAVDELQNNDFESAMMHVCNAIDNTVQRKTGEKCTNKSFTDYIRGYYDLLSAMVGLYGLDFEATRWPVTVERPKAEGGTPDLADMIYGIHRCAHAHGAELAPGFSFVPDIADSTGRTTLSIHVGAIGLSDKFIWALINILVLDPVNKGMEDPELDGYYLIMGGQKHIINELWGRLEDLPPLPKKNGRGILDFSQLKERTE